MIEVGPTDRVLLLAVPTPDQLRALSAQLPAGLCVVMGPEEDIRILRRSCADLENVMLIFDPEDGTVPWQDRFFTVAVAPNPKVHLQRVLAEGARVLASE